MGRHLRIDRPGAWHHIVNRGVERRDIFVDDLDRLEFGRLLGVVHQRFDVRVHAYCLMSNHYHLLVECPNGRLSDAMHLLGSLYVRHFNDRTGRDGPLFRGRFFAREVHDDSDLVAVTRYIHRNPLAFLPVGRLETFRWSSLRTYLELRRQVDWLRTDVVSALVGGPAGMRELCVDLGQSRLAPLRPSTWAHLAEVVADEHLDDRSARRATRSLLAFLLDEVSGTPDELSLRSALAFSTTNAEHSARSRARRMARSSTDFSAAAAALRAAA